MSDLETLLELVARDVDFHCTQEDAHTFPRSECRKHGECAALVGEVLVVLKRRLLPMLEAGEIAINTIEVIRGSSGATKAWHAAKKRAMEG